MQMGIIQAVGGTDGGNRLTAANDLASMHQHPFVNSRWVERGQEAAVEIIGDVNIGIAIAIDQERGGGLVVATLRNADRMGLRQISAQARAMAEKPHTIASSPKRSP